MQINEVIDQIFEMEYEDLIRVLKALTLRWCELHPDEILYVVSTPKNDQEGQKRLVEDAIRMIDRLQGRENL